MSGKKKSGNKKQKGEIAWFKIAKFFLVAFWAYVKKEFDWSFVGRCLMVFLVLAALAVFLIHSATAINLDLGRDLKMGQIIWETKQVPTTNLFSYAEPDYSFLNHHWLSDVIYYLLSLKVGISGLIVFNAIIFLTAFAIIFSLAYRRRFFVSSLLAMTLSAGLLIERTNVGPEVFGFLFFALFLFILEKNKERITWSFWLLLPLQLLWVNFHLSFYFGLAFLFFFFLDRLWERRKTVYLLARQKKFDKYLTQVVLGGILLGLVCFINPNAWRGAIYPLFIFGNHSYAIVENQSPFFSGKLMLGSSIIFFKAAIVCLFFAFLLSWRRIRPFYLIGSAFLVLTAWSAIRDFSILGLFLPLALAGNFLSIHENFAGLFAKLRKSTTLVFLRYLTIGVIFVILGASIYSVVSNRYYLKMAKSERFGLAVPSEAGAAVAFLKENKISGRVFNNFSVGSYLIWQLYPGQQVFADSRPEAHSEKFWQSIYIPIQQDEAAWQYYADKVYNFDYIFFAHTDATPWGQKFVQRIIGDKNWRMVYLNSSIAIWLRNSEANKPLLEKLGLEEGQLPLDINAALGEGDYNKLLRFGSFFRLVGINDVAVLFFEKALSIYSGDEKIWLACGVLKSNNGNFDGAKNDFNAVLKLNSKNIEAYLNLGKIYYQQGSFSEARRAWQKVLEIEPENQNAKTYLDNMGLIPFKK